MTKPPARPIAQDSDEEDDAIDPVTPGVDSSGYVPEDEPTLFEFTIPKSARTRKADPKIIVLSELSQPKMASARMVGQADKSGGDAVVIASIYEVDGHVVNHAEDEGLHFFAKWGPKVRTLVKVGWGEIHATTEAEDKAFLSSMKPR